MTKIPKNNKWVQSQISDVFGTLWASKGIDLSENFGRLNISQRTFVNRSTLDLANLGLPVAFKRFDAGTGNGILWAYAGSRMFKIASSTPYLSTNFTQDALSSTPTTLDNEKGDLAVFADNLIVSTGTSSVHRLNSSGTWTTWSTTGSPRKLETYGERLYFSTNGNRIYSMNTSFTEATSGQYTLQIENDEGSEANFILDIKAGTNRVWIATINRMGGRGSIYEWDGTSSTYSKRYLLESEGALALCIKDDVPYAVDTRGRLLMWNGGAFTIIAKLKEGSEMMRLALSQYNDDRFVSPNGMAVIDDEVNIIVNAKINDYTESTLERIPSGIYEYTKETGLYLKHSISNYEAGASVLATGLSNVEQVGALVPISTQTIASATAKGTFLFGFSYKDTTGTVRHAIGYDDTLLSETRTGYFVLNKIESSSVSDEWQNLYIVHSPLSGSDKFVVKYRTAEMDRVQATITWTSTTSFTTTTDLSAYVGYEVDILTGVGSGICAHIESVTGSGTFTVVIDETVTGATGTATVAVQNWTKITQALSTESYTQFGLPTGCQSTWIQFKVWGIGTGKMEIQRILLQHEQFI